MSEVRYAGSEEYIAFNWRAVVEDFMELAHPWAQIDWYGTQIKAREVLEKHGGVIETGDALREFIDCFGTHPLLEDSGPEDRCRYIPADVRRRVRDRDGDACVVCGSTDDLTFDHVKPFSKGGRHTTTNLRVLCRPCNSSKGDRTDEEWLGGAD